MNNLLLPLASLVTAGFFVSLMVHAGWVVLGAPSSDMASLLQSVKDAKETRHALKSPFVTIGWGNRRKAMCFFLACLMFLASGLWLLGQLALTAKTFMGSGIVHIGTP